MDATLQRPTTVLVQILEEQGRRQGWLARRMGVSDSHLSRLLTGEKAMSPARAEQIAAILALPLAVFYRDGRLSVAEEAAAAAEATATEVEAQNG